MLLGVDNGGTPVGLEADYASIRKPGKNDRDLVQLHLVNVLNGISTDELWRMSQPRAERMLPSGSDDKTIWL